ncbi:MAG: ribonuclease R [Alphaproteobacteria bacterium]
MAKKAPRTPGGRRRGRLPSKDELIEFLRAQDGRPSGREIARAFNLTGAERTEIKHMLRELAAKDGTRVRRGRRAGALPPVTVVEVAEIDADGDALVRPAAWRGEEPPPKIYLARAGVAEPAVGDRLLARLRRAPDGSYDALPIKRLPVLPGRTLGVFRSTGEGGRLTPTERGQRNEFHVDADDTLGAASGELVSAEVLGQRRWGLTRVRIVERLGDAAGPRAASLIAIHAAGLPVAFPAEANAHAAALAPAPADARTDLRHLPLVTIDGADARDFDDAVHAEPDDDPGNPGGWRITVAIADVAWYVRPDDPVDREAFRRGNSAYFPDRVVPMLPEVLSNDLCSLRPAEERACLAARIWIAGDGRIRRHRFQRARMRSAARLTYGQVQAAADGRPDATTAPLLSDVIGPLYGAFAALDGAGRRRGTLALELPERQVVFDADGRVARIAPRPRLDSHRLIEAFMIAANVAAAETLERRRQPCMYRVHDAPDPLKVEALREVLAGLGIRLPRAQVLGPGRFNRVLERVAGTAEERLVNELVLRAQAQAGYSPANIGHFGLGLRRYAHFTSPIRRYADLLVHRALIRGHGLGEGGLPAEIEARYEQAGEHLSMTERRAMIAEREAMDRYLAAFLSDRIGAVFAGHLTGVTHFGLFARLDDSGAEGLIPISTLPADLYHHDEGRHALTGEANGLTFTLGDAVEVRLAEADATKGGIIFHLTGAGEAAIRGGKRPPRARVKRPARRRRS